MKVYQSNQIKNIAVLGNSKSGKTLLAETMLFNGGIIERRGEIEQGNTVSDYRKIEQDYKSSIFSSVLYTEWKDKKINIIDAPGSDDFIGGVISALYVTDTALIVINSQNGVEVGTEIHSRYVEKVNKPMAFVINQLDHDKANFEKNIENLKDRFGNQVILAQYSVECGEGFNKIIDIISMKLYTCPAGGGKPEISEIPEAEMGKAKDLYNKLVEKAAESKESLMEIFFEKEALTEEELISGLQAGLVQREIYPVFCVSAKKNVGISRLMDIITEILPLPCDMPAPDTTEGEKVQCNPAGAPAIFIFKTSIESHIGEINYFKVMSGVLTESIDLVNNNTYSKERFAQLFVSAGKNRIKVEKLVAGDIGATVKLKNTKTNHTLSLSGKDWNFPFIEFPNPKYRTAIKPLSEGDEEKLGESLNRMHEEDPTIIIEYSKELKQIIVHGQGEHHLNILKWHLDNVFKLNTEFIPPKIPYRETITKVSQATYRHKKQSGGAGQFGEVHLVVEPYVPDMPNPTYYKVGGQDMKVSVRGKEEFDLPWGGKLIYFNCIVGGAIEARFIPAILKGLMEKMEDGPLTGSYARDVRVAVYDGKMHTVDSNDISFRLAGRNAFKEAFKNAGPKIMEPIYDIEVYVPSDRMGDVISDLTTRRGIVLGMSNEKGYEKIRAKVPLAEMNRYSTTLSSLTNGRAMYNMKFAEYQQVPGEIQDKLIKAFEAQDQEE
ncbi:MAG: elongation factor G [Bacteroidia bacterium]|nr:elongation factor G [Bacteroidia bacterium]